MQITSDTLYIAFQPFEKFLKKGEIEKIKKQAPFAVIGKDGYMSLTIADFNAIALHGDLSRFLDGRAENTLTVFEYYTLAGLKDFFEGYAKSLEKLAVKPTAKESAAQAACLKVGIVEGMLIFARDYFGLQSFAAAEKVTLAELLMARKDAYNKAIFERALTAQYQKNKKK
jgi:hypothetical protein